MQLNIFFDCVFCRHIGYCFIYCLLINFMLMIFSLLLGKTFCQYLSIIYKLCLSFRSVVSVCLFCLFVCLSVCLSVCRCCVLLLLHAAPKTRRLRVVLVLTQQKAARACDLRWFRPPLVDLTTENDSRIEDSKI